MSPASTYRLDRSAPAPLPVPVLDAQQQRVVDHPGGPLRVLAGPGTGKTTTLAEAVVQRVTGRLVPVDQILVVTFGRQAAAQLRDRITARLGRTVREPVARTIHSYAYGVLRLAALRAGSPAPRLLAAAEQDVIVRELLTGPQAAALWPAELAPALATHGFADQLRDLLAWAVERGLGPAQLEGLGVRHRRPEWVAAGRFMREYQQVTSLQLPGYFDAAELISAAMSAFEADPELLRLERDRRRHVFVDEYQDVDPAQADLLHLLAAGAAEFVVVGDPDQSIYAFRGSQPRALAEFVDRFQAAVPPVPVPAVALLTCRRFGGQLLSASRRLARLLPPPVEHRELVAAAGTPPGSVQIGVYRSVAEEAMAAAAVFRRAHLVDGMAWSQMAVIVRSAITTADPLRRALVAAGVPVDVGGITQPFAAQPLVNALVAALRYCLAPPSEAVAADAAVEALLASPLAGADQLALRRLYRTLNLHARAAGATEPGGAGVPGRLAELAGNPARAAALPPAVGAPLMRLAAILDAGWRAADRTDRDLEQVLWAVWSASRMERALEARSLAGGIAGQAADRDLDAVVELFAAAARFADQFDHRSALEFADTVAGQLLPEVRATAGRERQTVRILTAHASKGLEWELVWVAGVQDGGWPDLRRRGSVLAADLLADVVAGHAMPGTALTDVALAEERRLFYVAVTRARRRLVVSAVSDAQSTPSRFLTELVAPSSSSGGEPSGDHPMVPVEPGLHLPALVAELRAVVTDPGADPSPRQQAAVVLAELATQGVPGAHPDSWWGLAESTWDGPIRAPADGLVKISPSGLQGYQRCQLQALMGELGARDGEPPVSASLGTVIHAVAAEAPDLADRADLERRLDAVWDALEFGAPWYAQDRRRAASQFLDRLSDWFIASRAAGLQTLGVEVPVDVAIGDDAVLVGRVDRLERDAEGRTVVVDLKTSRTGVGTTDLAQHPQLQAYQLAVRLGAFAGAPDHPGGARLVQLAPTAGKNVEQIQPPLDDPALVEQVITDLAAVLRGAQLLATVHAGCERCAIRYFCPAQPTSRSVTS